MKGKPIFEQCCELYRSVTYAFGSILYHRETELRFIYIYIYVWLRVCVCVGINRITITVIHYLDSFFYHVQYTWKTFFYRNVIKGVEKRLYIHMTPYMWLYGKTKKL